MEYYVIYDKEDNLVCYLDNYEDLCRYTGLRRKDINYKFKKSNEFIQVVIDKKLYNVYKFC